MKLKCLQFMPHTQFFNKLCILITHNNSFVISWNDYFSCNDKPSQKIQRIIFNQNISTVSTLNFIVNNIFLLLIMKSEILVLHKLGMNT